MKNDICVIPNECLRGLKWMAFQVSLKKQYSVVLGFQVQVCKFVRVNLVEGQKVAINSLIPCPFCPLHSSFLLPFLPLFFNFRPSSSFLSCYLQPNLSFLPFTLFLHFIHHPSFLSLTFLQVAKWLPRGQVDFAA